MALNQKKFLDSAGLTYFAQLLDNYPDNEVLASVIDAISDALDEKGDGHIANFAGTCETAAATTTKAVTCDDFTSTDLVPGAIIVVSFTTTNSGAVGSLQLNVNNTGAYPIKYNNAGTISNLGSAGYLKADSSYMFYFDGAHWVIAGYDTNTNTVGYTIRGNGLSLPITSAMYRYRILFTSADGEHLIPANASTSTSATTAKTVPTDKINPWGKILYYNTTTAVTSGNRPTASNLCQQYNGVTLGYSFNRTGAALTLTAWKPIYIKCAPQTDGTAIIDADTPYVQDLPSTEDGKIYIFLGIATAATTIEMTLEHPIYYYKDGCIRPWINPTATTYTETDPVFSVSAAAGIDTLDIENWNNKAGLWKVGGSYNDDYGWWNLEADRTYLHNISNAPGSSATIHEIRFPTGQSSYLTIDNPLTNAGRSIKLTIPSSNGTLALTTDIPTVPTNISSFTNDSGYLTLATLPVYDGTVV